MPNQMILKRRTLLRGAALSALFTPLGTAAWAGTAPAPYPPFVEAYQTNLGTNLTYDSNAAVRALSGMAKLWRTGATWNTGQALDERVLRASMRHVIRATRSRTDSQAERAFLLDRRNQSFSAIDGLGPLAPIYRAGALAVTSITSAPTGTPPAAVTEVVPADAPPGSALGAGSPASALGAVVTLVNTVRGSFASGNPSKYSYQYPRPWRMTVDSVVADTGVLDQWGYPVYESDVVVAPQLLLQRSLSPIDDAGFPSGHTNAFHLAALALAYAIPQRFQELVAAAYDLSDSRIVAGMHSPVDVLGGRVLATALAAATLADPANAAIKTAAVAQAATYLQAQTNTNPDTLFAYAHSAGPDTDAYANRADNEWLVAFRSTYGLPATRSAAPMTVPEGAEVLLETRLPYLDAGQRREVLRTTAFTGGHPILDGPELWGRLNLFAAADSFGSFARDVVLTMNGALGGFHAADVWRNAIDGRGRLVKQGTGALTLTGANRFSGGTVLAAGTLTAGSTTALGTGDVLVRDGTLQVPAGAGLHLHRDFEQSGGTLSAVAGHPAPVLTVGGHVALGGVLRLAVDRERTPGKVVPVIKAARLTGRFARIEITTPGYRAEPVYTGTGLSVRLYAT